MSCDHGMRWGDRVFACELDRDHGDDPHTGTHPEFGDTKVSWLTGDRRDFIGADPGGCGQLPGGAMAPASEWSDYTQGQPCVLPAGHHGRHAS
jgi:hypothetical protein